MEKVINFLKILYFLIKIKNLPSYHNEFLGRYCHMRSYFIFHYQTTGGNSAPYWDEHGTTSRSALKRQKVLQTEAKKNRK